VGVAAAAVFGQSKSISTWVTRPFQDARSTVRLRPGMRGCGPFQECTSLEAPEGTNVAGISLNAALSRPAEWNTASGATGGVRACASWYGLPETRAAGRLHPAPRAPFRPAGSRIVGRHIAIGIGGQRGWALAIVGHNGRFRRQPFVPSVRLRELLKLVEQVAAIVDPQHGIRRLGG